MGSTLVLSKLLEEKNSKNNQVFFDRYCCAEHETIKSSNNLLGPTGCSLKELRQDTAEVFKIYKFLLNQLASILNKYHNKNENNRFWEVLIGQWLNTYIKIFYNRIRTLEKGLINFKVTNIRIGNYENYDFSSNETGGYYESTRNLEWDMMFKSRAAFELLKYYKNIKFEKSYFQQSFFSNYNHYEDLKKKRLKNNLSFVLKNLNLFNFQPHVIFDETYFGLKKEVYYQLLLGQYPFIFLPKKIAIAKKNLQLRSELGKNFFSTKNYKVNILKSNLLEDLPLIFLEGFKFLESEIKFSNLPKNPKVIFTSNSFFFNESFKYYTAINLHKLKYFIGQHGSSYGTHITHQFSPEYRTSDKFITWGQKDTKKDRPLFNFKKQFVNPNFKKKYFLVINRTLGYPVETWDKTDHYYKHFKNRNNFIENLNYCYKEDLIFRLHKGFKIRFPKELEILKKKFKDIKIDDGEHNIYNLINKSKIVIFTYYSTGFLELVLQDTPTLCIEEDLMFRLRKKYKKIFQEMIENKIIYNDFDTMLTFINNNTYQSLYDWWNSKKILKIRVNFSNIFSKKPNKKDLNSFLDFLKK